MEPYGNGLGSTLAATIHHTPGPWRFETLSRCCRVQAYVVGAHDTFVATTAWLQPTSGHWLKPARQQSLANGHLIAAAPELYRLLQGLAQALDLGQSITPDSQTHLLIQHVLDGR